LSDFQTSASSEDRFFT